SPRVSLTMRPLLPEVRVGLVRLSWHRAPWSRSRPLREWPGVPDADGPVEAARGEQVAVRAERYAEHALRMASEREDLLAAGRARGLGRAAIAARGDPPTIGAEHHIEPRRFGAGEFVELPARRDIEHLHKTESLVETAASHGELCPLHVECTAPV